MRTAHPIRRARQAALAAFALSAAVLLSPAVPGLHGFASPAFADEAAAIDTSRLVSIGGAVTEIVYALQEGDRLVARDSTSLYPPEAEKLPDVGYMRALSPEGVIALNPSAILAVEGSGPPEALAVLKDAGVPFVTVPEGYDRETILRKITVVGEALGVPDKAKALVDTVSADLDQAIALAAARPESERKRVLFVLSFQGGKILAAGSHTAADGIIRLAGAINATDDTFQGYKPLSDEAVINASPDVILMMNRGAEENIDTELLAHPAVALTPAAANKAVLRFDGLHLLGFGPRTASAVRGLNEALYDKNDHVPQ